VNVASAVSATMLQRPPSRRVFPERARRADTSVEPVLGGDACRPGGAPGTAVPTHARRRNDETGQSDGRAKRPRRSHPIGPTERRGKAPPVAGLTGEALTIGW
jgi:hypothetical protein